MADLPYDITDNLTLPMWISVSLRSALDRHIIFDVGPNGSTNMLRNFGVRFKTSVLQPHTPPKQTLVGREDKEDAAGHDPANGIYPRACPLPYNSCRNRHSSKYQDVAKPNGSRHDRLLSCRYRHFATLAGHSKASRLNLELSTA
jgi:hypothetical protein